VDSIFLLVPIVIVFIVIAVKLFFWAVNSGQYDDLETEGRRILFDDDLPEESHPEADTGSAEDDQQHHQQHHQNNKP